MKFCFTYSQMQMTALMCTFRDRIFPNCWISTQESISFSKIIQNKESRNFTRISSTGIPVFSFPRTKTHFLGNSNLSSMTDLLVCSKPTIYSQKACSSNRKLARLVDWYSVSDCFFHSNIVQEICWLDFYDGHP